MTKFLIFLHNYGKITIKSTRFCCTLMAIVVMLTCLYSPDKGTKKSTVKTLHSIEIGQKSMRIDNILNVMCEFKKLTDFFIFEYSL